MTQCTLHSDDQRIMLYIDGRYLCDRLSINEWNALFSRYENDPQSTIINRLDDAEHNTNYAIIMTTLLTVLSKGAILDLQFMRGVYADGKWQTECLH